MSVVILFASLAWKGRGERAYSDGVSHKRRFVFLKIGQYISSIYRYKLCAFETLLTKPVTFVTLGADVLAASLI